MSKRVHGNKEVKKPKQGARVVPPAPGGPGAPAPSGWPKPQQAKK